MFVLVSILNQGAIHPGLNKALEVMRDDPRHLVDIEYPADQPVCNNRNSIVKRMLGGDYDYLIMIDGNDTVPMFNPLELVELGLDVVGGACPQWRDGDIYWIALDKVKGGYKPIVPERRVGLQQVDAIGTGCICIKREVLKRVKAPFMRKWSEDGIATLGGDFYFCEKVKAAGLEVWVDWSKICDHIKKVGLLSVLNLLGDKIE